MPPSMKFQDPRPLRVIYSKEELNGLDVSLCGWRI